MFGIDASAYDGWRANQYAVNGALSFANISEAIALAQGRGLSGSIKGYVHPLVFRSLLPDYVALRTTGVAQSRTLDKGETENLAHGTKSIQFYVNSVETDIIATNYCKRGYAAFVNTEDLLRVGSTPMTFNLPGVEGSSENYFTLKQDKNAICLNAKCAQALVA